MDYSKFLNKAAQYGIFDETKRFIENVKGATFEKKSYAVKLTGISYLLGINSSAKTVKGEKYNYLTGILYLAASDNSGVNICPKATESCAKACLFFSGRASMTTNNESISRINKSRFLKTVLFFVNRTFFMDWLFWEIDSLQRKAKRENKFATIRLNGTSDINLATFKNSKGENVLDAYPNIQFYDYTKVPTQFKNVRDNYDLTFSFGGYKDIESLFNTFDAVLQGQRISVPFVKETFKNGFPETFLGLPVHDGDLSDLTFKSPQMSILGLGAKVPIKKVERNVSGNDFFVTAETLPMIEKMFEDYKYKKHQNKIAA